LELEWVVASRMRPVARWMFCGEYNQVSSGQNENSGAMAVKADGMEGEYKMSRKSMGVRCA
jgi:hypothetical protein